MATMVAILEYRLNSFFYKMFKVQNTVFLHNGRYTSSRCQEQLCKVS